MLDEPCLRDAGRLRDRLQELELGRIQAVPSQDRGGVLRGAVNDSREGTEDLPSEVANLGATEASRFGELLAGGEVYTDDKAPVEWLIDRSILGYAGDN